MKIYITLFLCIISTLSTNAQLPGLEWVKHIEGSSTTYSQGNAIVLDSLGNVYTTGSFQGTVDFDPSAVVYNLTSIGLEDIFIAKFNSSGNLLWVKQIGGVESDVANAIKLDASGNIYTSGAFKSTVDFDPNTTVFNLTSASFKYDMFVLKLDASGNFKWAKAMGGKSDDISKSIALDKFGNVYTTGTFMTTCDFDPDTSVYNVSIAGTDVFLTDLFICKLDSSGKFVWAKGIGANGNDRANSIDIDNSSGTVYTTGGFQGSVDFDPGSAVYKLSAGGGDVALFVLKLDFNGNYIWAKHVPSVSINEGQGIKIDAKGNVYTTGDFKGLCDFDPGTAIVNLNAVAGSDIFILKLNQSGDFIWAKAFNGKGLLDQGKSIYVDSAENVYTTGMFSDTVDFDPGSGTYNLATVATVSVGIGSYISKLDALGNFVWAEKLDDYTAAKSICVDLSGYVYTTGAFRGTIDFEPGKGTYNLTSPSNSAFVYKLNQNRVATSIVENPLSIDNMVYPNPSSGIFNLKISDPSPSTKIEVYNPLGVLIQEVAAQQGINTIDVTNFATGIYLLRIVNNHEVLLNTFKIDKK